MKTNEPQRIADILAGWEKYVPTQPRRWGHGRWRKLSIYRTSNGTVLLALPGGPPEVWLYGQEMLEFWIQQEIVHRVPYDGVKP